MEVNVLRRYVTHLFSGEVLLHAQQGGRNERLPGPDRRHEPVKTQEQHGARQLPHNARVLRRRRGLGRGGGRLHVAAFLRILRRRNLQSVVLLRGAAQRRLVHHR